MRTPRYHRGAHDESPKLCLTARIQQDRRDSSQHVDVHHRACACRPVPSYICSRTRSSCCLRVSPACSSPIVFMPVNQRMRRPARRCKPPPPPQRRHSLAQSHPPAAAALTPTGELLPATQVFSAEHRLIDEHRGATRRPVLNLADSAPVPNDPAGSPRGIPDREGASGSSLSSHAPIPATGLLDRARPVVSPGVRNRLPGCRGFASRCPRRPRIFRYAASLRPERCSVFALSSNPETSRRDH